MNPQQDIYINEFIRIPMQLIEMKAVRSSGPGGQHVNKVSTKIELHYHFNDAFHLPHDILSRLLSFASIKFDAEGNILITSQKYRSQKDNAEDALQKLKGLILKALIPPKIRKATKPSKSSREDRIVDKKKRGMIKQQRQSGNILTDEE